MKPKLVFAFFIATLLFSTFLLLQMIALAYDPKVESDLKYSRDALLKQRSELKAAIDRKGTQIVELQRDTDRLNAYLQDTDRALRNIDLALRGD